MENQLKTHKMWKVHCYEINEGIVIIIIIKNTKTVRSSRTDKCVCFLELGSHARKVQQTVYK